MDTSANITEDFQTSENFICSTVYRKQKSDLNSKKVETFDETFTDTNNISEVEDPLKAHIEKKKLNLTFRSPTGKDGNCWYYSITDQIILNNLDLPRDPHVTMY